MYIPVRLEWRFAAAREIKDWMLIRLEQKLKACRHSSSGNNEDVLIENTQCFGLLREHKFTYLLSCLLTN